MASPLTHLATGYAVYGLSEGNKNWLKILNWRFFLILAVSQLPDCDAIIGFATDNMYNLHNQWSNSLFVAILVTGIIALGVFLLQKKMFIRWWCIFASCYILQIIIDFLTVGRGLMLFWPLTSQRFSSPIKFFYGLHWSDGIFSIKHLYTLCNEITIIVIVSILFIFIKRSSSDKKER